MNKSTLQVCEFIHKLRFNLRNGEIQWSASDAAVIARYEFKLAESVPEILAIYWSWEMNAPATKPAKRASAPA